MNPGWLPVNGAHLNARDLEDLIAYTLLRPGSDLEFGGVR